MKFTIKAE